MGESLFRSIMPSHQNKLNFQTLLFGGEIFPCDICCFRTRVRFTPPWLSVPFSLGHRGPSGCLGVEAVLLLACTATAALAPRALSHPSVGWYLSPPCEWSASPCDGSLAPPASLTGEEENGGPQRSGEIGPRPLGCSAVGPGLTSGLAPAPECQGPRSPVPSALSQETPVLCWQRISSSPAAARLCAFLLPAFGHARLSLEPSLYPTALSGIVLPASTSTQPSWIVPSWRDPVPSLM